MKQQLAFQTKSVRIVISACMVALLGWSGQISADPQSKPTLTLAPYVLSNTDLRQGDGGAKAYRPWFENGAWTGDLIEYNISAEGVRCTSVVPGSYPPDDSGNYDVDQCPHFNWSARGAFPDKIEQPDGTLIDDPDTANYWEEIRNLLIFDPSNSIGRTAPFWWDELDPYQKHALDESTCGPLVEDSPGVEKCSLADQTAKASSILNFIRGDRSEERDKPGGVFRLRYSVLGPIINSRPVFVPVGDNGIVVVGANDGIIHAFDASDGSELFGYVPSLFFPSLKELVDSPYSLTYFADGELRSAEIAPGRHIVTGGFGAGGKGLFALEISSTNPSNPKILFELSGTDGDHLAGDFESRVGNVYGRPTIARLPDNRWYIVTGNGYNSGAGARLVLIDIESGAISYIDADTGGAPPDPENGLSAPALVSSTASFTQSNFAYAGDLKGNLYRFDLAKKTATLLFAAGNTKPITVEPDIARHPTSVGIMIYFGTGRLLTAADASTLTTQSIYGIWDETFTATEIDEGKLLTQTLVPRTGNWDGSPKTVRVLLQDKHPIWGTDAKNLGWRVDLTPGERLLGRPQVRAKRLQFITTNPTSDFTNMEAGDGSWFNQLSLESGGSLSPPAPLYDLDRSGALDDGDAWLEPDPIEGHPNNTKMLYPLGLNLGAGNIAQPAFASVTTDIDAVFINALLLPSPFEPPENSSLGGTLDVTTDSPSGPRVNPHDPGHPKYEDYGYGDTYPDYGDVPPARGPMNVYLAQDGLGGQVDGHHRAYNKVHAVDYVDFFDLEPQARAGGRRLDPGWLAEDGKPFMAMRELNQPGESPWGNPLVESNKEFIVLLTNADLSLGVNIQIGCRKWNAFEYQEMITSQLLAGKTPSELIDQQGRGLVFTLDTILNDTGGGVGCDVSTRTLRFTFSGRVGGSLPNDFGTPVLMGTLPGCVNNTHNYVGQPINPLTDPFPHPHITPNQENPNGGYRWRNGALTMQLLDAASYQLELDYRPTAKSNSPTLGKGGLYAKAFNIDKVNGKDVITPLDGPNGLLYESSIFWNWGDMWEFQQEGFQSVCYGASNYNSAFVNELGGLNKAQYDQLVKFLKENEELQDAYAAALLALDNASTDEEIVAALQNLQAIFELIAGGKGQDAYSMGYYHILKNYAHGEKFTNLDLLDMDKSLFQPPPAVDLSIDGTPADVQDVELDLLPAAGPNFAPGRRSWIDVTPQ